MNPSPSSDVVVEIEAQPMGLLERTLIETLVVPAGGLASWALPADMISTATSSSLWTGRVVLLTSSEPVDVTWEPALSAAPAVGSVVDPTHALQSEYTVGEVHSFEVMALAQEGSQVEWSPSVRTAGAGILFPPTDAGEIGSLVLNPTEGLRLSASTEFGDPEPLTGTVVSADRPFLCVGCD